MCTSPTTLRQMTRHRWHVRMYRNYSFPVRTIWWAIYRLGSPDNNCCRHPMLATIRNRRFSPDAAKRAVCCAPPNRDEQNAVTRDNSFLWREQTDLDWSIVTYKMHMNVESFCKYEYKITYRTQFATPKFSAPSLSGFCWHYRSGNWVTNRAIPVPGWSSAEDPVCECECSH